MGVRVVHPNGWGRHPHGGRGWIACGAISLLVLLPYPTWGISEGRPPGERTTSTPTPLGAPGPVRAPTGAPVGNTTPSPGANWTDLTFGAAPPWGTLLVNDTSDGYLLGYHANDTNGPAYNQSTWRFSPSSWKNITYFAGMGPYSSNAGRFGVALTYDGRDGYVLAFASPGQTWEFHGGVWAQLQPACAALCDYLRIAPEFKLAYDPVLRAVILYDGSTLYTPGGTVWTFAADTWSPLCSGPNTTNYTDCWGTGPTPLAGAFGGDGSPGLAFDPRGREMVLFGGFGPDATGVRGPDCETWTLNNTTWTELRFRPTDVPPCRDLATLATDPDRGSAILFGGLGWTCLQGCMISRTYAFNDTWGFSGGYWRNLTAGRAPPPEAAPSVVFSPALDGMLAFEGGPDAGYNAWPAYNQTWFWGPVTPLTGVRALVDRTNITVDSPDVFHGLYRTADGPVSYRWNFSDGSNASTASPTVVFYSPGLVRGLLTITDRVGRSARASVTVNVVPDQAGTVFLAPNPADAGQPVQFGVAVSGGVGPFALLWVFGDGNAATGAYTNHSYGEAGVYRVTLWMNGSDGSSRVVQRAVSVNDQLVAPTIALTPDPAPLDGAVYLSATPHGGTPPYTYAWSLGDGTTAANESTISHVFASDAPYRVTLEVRDADGEVAVGSVVHSTALTVEVVAGATIGAAPLSVTFSATALGGFPGYAFFWAFGDGAVANGSFAYHTFDAVGNYTVALVANDTRGDLVVRDVNLTVEPPGPLALTLLPSQAQAVLGETVGFSARPSGGIGAYLVTWYMPSGCRFVTELRITCLTTTVGALYVRVTLADAQNGFVAANVSVPVVSTTPGTTPVTGTPSVPSAGGIPWLLPFVAGVGVAAAAFVAGLLVARRPPPPAPRLAKQSVNRVR